MDEKGKNEIKTCPFCGETPVIWRYNGGCTIQCRSERHMAQAEARTEEEAIEEWNRRSG